MVRFVQLGIDLKGITDNGGQANWIGAGGHGTGRKWPILFAGLVLDDAGMKNIDSQNIAFGEDQQTFYVRETSPGVFNNGHGGYTAAHRGMPEWGMRHATKPSDDTPNWNEPYRLCCTANAWLGHVLAARLMGAKSLWNHDALFDYTDRYVSECRKRKAAAWETSWDPWTLEMWDAYRNAPPPPPPPQIGAPTGLQQRVRPASNFARPTGMHPQGAKFMEVRITWNKPSSAKSYKIYRGPSAANLSVHQTGIETETFIDVALPSNGSYWYAVTAVDQNGKESARSMVMEVKT